MGLFFVYILKSSVCLAIFYLFYRLLLARETFHRFNRFSLLGILLLSCLLPLVEVSVKQETEVHQTMLTLEQLLMMADAVNATEAGARAETATVIWIQVALLVYLAGIVFFAFRNVYSLVRLLMLLKSGKKEDIGSYLPGRKERVTLIVHNCDIAPFSWMGYIVISRKDLEENGREILIHELAHIHNRHSWDLLVADVCIFFQWFNPASWLLKQELQNIHEFEADETVIKEGVDAKQYQLLLIKKAVGTRLYSMANSFNHSKLKKRITMMLKEKSNPWARLKYLYVLPLAAIAVTAFARPEISEKMEEISAVKVNDLAEIVEKKSEENVVKELVDTTKNKVVVVGYRTEKKDSVLTSGKKKVAISVQGISGEGKPLVIINGKESDREVVNALNPERIESVSVIGPEKAIKIYGEKAKDGVMDIKLYSEKKFAPRKIEIEGINKTRLDALNSGAKSWGATFRSADGGKPLVIIDGKEATGDDPLANISPDRIRSISVLKDKTALAAYGDKGKNGVVEVNLLVKEEYQARQISIRAINDTVTSTIKVTASEE